MTTVEDQFKLAEEYKFRSETIDSAIRQLKAVDRTLTPEIATSQSAENLQTLIKEPLIKSSEDEVNKRLDALVKFLGTYRGSLESKSEELLSTKIQK